MNEQHALFCDPHFTDAYEVGDRVRSTFTNNTGQVTHVEPGRHLLIKWGASYRDPDGYTARHSSALGLEREDAS